MRTTCAQVEQDLLLSRLIIEVANHPYLGGELVFRGGTCLHKLHLDTPRRYSEDRDGGWLRVKVEVNTHERSPARPLLAVPFTVASSWWSGTALVRTFTAPELVATKIRALFQRKKGRDLFDLWLALTDLRLDPGDILTAFTPCRPVGLTAKNAAANLRAKMDDAEFCTDLDLLVNSWPDGYDVPQAADLVIDRLHSRL